jgi:hypothetical protein
MSAFSCVVVYSVSKSLAMYRSFIQGILPKYPKGFIVSEVNSESEQARCFIREKYNNKQQRNNSSEVEF